MRQVCMSLIAAAYCAMASAGTVSAQETINQGAISGRVLDAQGAAVPGVVVIVRQTDTNVTVQAITEADGRFRFPYLKIGPVRAQGEAPGVQRQRPHAGAERRLRVRHFDHAGSGRHRRSRHRCRRQPAARDRAQPDRGDGSASGSPEPADERPEFSGPGAARPRGLTHQHEQHAAVRRNLRGSGAGALHRQSAQSLQQFHRRRRVGQRRCRRAERDHIRRRRHRAASSRDRRRPGRARPCARRLRQRGHEERHQRAARFALRVFSR